MSVRQMPATRLWTSTSPGAGDGVSISTNATSCGRSITTAFIGRAYILSGARPGMRGRQSASCYAVTGSVGARLSL